MKKSSLSWLTWETVSQKADTSMNKTAASWSFNRSRYQEEPKTCSLFCMIVWHEGCPYQFKLKSAASLVTHTAVFFLVVVSSNCSMLKHPAQEIWYQIREMHFQKVGRWTFITWIYWKTTEKDWQECPNSISFCFSNNPKVHTSSWTIIHLRISYIWT